MSALDKLTPGGFTPASVIDELRTEQEALRGALADVWAISQHHVAHHTIGGEALVRRVDALLLTCAKPAVEIIPQSRRPL